MQGSSKLNASSSCNDKPPSVNWPHHANAMQSARSRDDFLSSSFLFSLPTQRANPEADIMLSLRYACFCYMQCYVLNLSYPRDSCSPHRQHKFLFPGLLLVKFKARNAFKFHGSRRYVNNTVTCYQSPLNA
jgi:hypothetical protein